MFSCFLHPISCDGRVIPIAVATVGLEGWELDLHPTSGLQLSAEAEKIDRDGSCTIVD